MRAWARRYGAALAASSLCLLAPGCGEEKSFTTQEFVEEVRAEGVQLSLGEELFTDEEGLDLHAIELPQVAELPGENGEEQHGAGSLSVYDDTGDADEKFASCEQTADLLCYQAANVVVVLEGGGIEAQQLGVAMQRLSEE